MPSLAQIPPLLFVYALFPQRFSVIPRTTRSYRGVSSNRTDNTADVRRSRPGLTPAGSRSRGRLPGRTTHTGSPRHPLYLVAAHTPPNLRAQGEPVSCRRRVVGVGGNHLPVTDEGDHEACPGIATGAGQRVYPPSLSNRTNTPRRRTGTSVGASCWRTSQPFSYATARRDSISAWQAESRCKQFAARFDSGRLVDPMPLARRWWYCMSPRFPHRSHFQPDRALTSSRVAGVNPCGRLTRLPIQRGRAERPTLRC